MNAVIIVAGGTGTRMSQGVKSQVPKQFLDINGKPVIVYSIEAFLKADPQIKVIVSVHKDWMEKWREIKQTFFKGNQIEEVTGGETRFHSVKNALKVSGNSELIAIHDAVRPLASESLINRLYDVTRAKGSAIPVMPVIDSMRKYKSEKLIPVKRENYRIIQTPQCFSAETIVSSYEQDFTAEFTDDASVVEAAGYKLNFVPGERTNIKITVPEDLKIVTALLTRN